MGFAGVGKTTIFNAMTGQSAPVGYAGEARVGAVRVPDDRLDAISKLVEPKKTTHALMTLRDIPGERGSSSKVLSPKTLQELRGLEALGLVVADFRISGADIPDPAGEVSVFGEECILADLSVVERRLDRLRKERGEPQEIRAFEVALETLSGALPLRSVDPVRLPRSYLKGFGLLSDLPLLVLVNRDEEKAAAPIPSELKEAARREGAGCMALAAALEAEIAQLEASEQAEFLEELGIEEPALGRFIQEVYRHLDLISFFTVGEREARAWPIPAGAAATAAAGTIHSDMERGFIRAEVISYRSFLRYGSERAARRAGMLRVEGKGYEVKDGDILHILFGV